ncbi:MAG: isocitrate lyase/PEP mutase family protein [bacterium]
MSGKKLRELISRKELVVAPGAFSALTAKLVEEAGFNCVHLSGYCTAAFLYGYPDLGLVTMSEMLANARLLAEAVKLPLIADADTGYGNPINVVRTVRDFERAGCAALHMEDQVWPKRCGHMKGKRVISKEEMAAKIRAAVDARLSEDFIIIARTDAIAMEGLDSAIERLHTYAAAGADVVFADGQSTMEQIERVPRECPEAPSMINFGPLTPPLGPAEIQKLGYSIAVFPAVCLGAAVLSIQEALRALRGTGRTPALEGEGFMRIFGSLNKLLGVDVYTSLEQSYKF